MPLLFQETIYPFISPQKSFIHTFIGELKSVIQLKEVSIVNVLKFEILYYTPSIRNMPNGYIVFVGSAHPFVCPSFCSPVLPSVRPFVILSINICYNQVLLRSFLITYISAATDQKLFIFGMGVLGRVPFYTEPLRVIPRAGLEVKI